MEINIIEVVDLGEIILQILNSFADLSQILDCLCRFSILYVPVQVTFYDKPEFQKFFYLQGIPFMDTGD